MLNDAIVIQHIKSNLGFPFMQLEWTDTQILEHIKINTIREFSYYFPDVKKMSVNIQLEHNKVPGRGNEFYLNEPEGREILNVKNIYFDQSNYYALGHPPLGVFSEFEIRDWALRVSQAMTTKMFSSFDYTWEFSHPNIVRISPINFNETQFITVEYERMQSQDFGEIPNDMHIHFLKMCLGDVMIAIGRIRKKYSGNLRTPFGDVPISDDIFEEGKELKREVIEILERNFIPNIRICHG